jgi:cysteine desulfurase
MDQWVIYLDNAASEPLRPSVLQVMSRSQALDFANPSSAHQLGRTLSERIETCRQDFLDFLGLGAKEWRFVFTGSATESNNMVILGLRLGAQDSLVYSPADHPSMIGPALTCQTQGVPCRAWREGEDLGDLAISCLAVSQVNGQSGTIAPVNDLAQSAKIKNRQMVVHIDGSQAFGKIPVSLANSDIDSYSISAHKIGGPKGIAGLYLKRTQKLSPIMHGGGQEEGFRPSTLSAPHIFGFHKAAKESFSKIERAYSAALEVQNFLVNGLKQVSSQFQFPFLAGEKTSPYILTFIAPEYPSDVVMRCLEEKGVILSSTSACSSKIKGFNPTLAALGIPERLHKHVLRISLSSRTILAEIEECLRCFGTIWRELAPLSGLRS